MMKGVNKWSKGKHLHSPSCLTLHFLLYGTAFIRNHVTLSRASYEDACCCSFLSLLSMMIIDEVPLPFRLIYVAGSCNGGGGTLAEIFGGSMFSGVA